MVQTPWNSVLNSSEEEKFGANKGRQRKHSRSRKTEDARKTWEDEREQHTPLALCVPSCPGVGHRPHGTGPAPAPRELLIPSRGAAELAPCLAVPCPAVLKQHVRQAQEGIPELLDAKYYRLFPQIAM